MNRFITSWLVLFFCVVFTEAEEKSRPNFIIMIADDVSWNDLGCYGHPHVRTPNLDEVAKEGMRFDSAFLTCSSCSPSRCSILTGRYPHSTGAAELHQPLPANQVVFAGLLKEAGYHTASAGKWHLGNPAKTNFDKVVGGRPSGCENWVKVLKERPKDKPFFFWFAAIDAHRPYQEKIIDKPHTPKDVVVPPYFPDTKEVRRDLAQYYDEITRLDNYVGKVMKELKRQKIDKNTVVLFLADNGRPFPRCKTTVYDSGVKTPFIVRWPIGVKANSICKSLVSSVDIAPTIIELANLKSSKSFQGRSFAKLLSDPKSSIRDYIFAEHNWHDYQAHERAVRSNRYLFIENKFPQLTSSPPADAVRSPTYKAMQELHKKGKLNEAQRSCFIAPRPKEELYDIVSDPHCLNNLASSEKYSDTRKKMQVQLSQWKSRTMDRIPENPTPDQFDRITGARLKE